MHHFLWFETQYAEIYRDKEYHSSNGFLYLQAKKKKIEEVKIETLGLDIKPKFNVLQVVEPAAKKGGIKVVLQVKQGQRRGWINR